MRDYFVKGFYKLVPIATAKRRLVRRVPGMVFRGTFDEGAKAYYEGRWVGVEELCRRLGVITDCEKIVKGQGKIRAGI